MDVHSSRHVLPYPLLQVQSATLKLQKFQGNVVSETFSAAELVKFAGQWRQAAQLSVAEQICLGMAGCPARTLACLCC